MDCGTIEAMLNSANINRLYLSSTDRLDWLAEICKLRDTLVPGKSDRVDILVSENITRDKIPPELMEN